jgi:hypothetical protein
MSDDFNLDYDDDIGDLSSTDSEDTATSEFDELEKELMAAEHALEQDSSDHKLHHIRSASEAAALEKVGRDAVPLDDIHANFPAYDIVSSDEIASVKTHIKEDGSPDIDGYKADFYKMLGYDKGDINRDAENIEHLREEKDVPLPQEILNAESREDILQYLHDKSVMRIPDNHVEDVINTLTEDAKKYPENFSFPQELSPEDYFQDRIKGIGIDSQDLISLINKKKI